MKALYFIRIADPGIHVHICYRDKCLFFPDNNILIVKSSTGTFSSNIYLVIDKSDNEEIFNEIRELYDTEIVPVKEGVTYKDIKNVEVDITKEELEKMVEVYKLKKQFDVQVKEYLKKAENTIE